MLFLTTLFLALPIVAQAEEGPAKLDPAADAATATAFWTESKAELRNMWQLPEGYSAEKPRNMTIILHGTGSSTPCATKRS